MRAALPLLLLPALACTSGQRLELPTPGKLRSALRQVSALSAAAQLVPEGQAPAAEQPLEPSADGGSFSGFLATGPGRYTVEVVFRGVVDGSPSPVFLGRWTSDVVTVVAGSAAGATFSRPLDVLGRPEDGGDVDGDGVGRLDELLLGTRADQADSDGDGVGDGRDCRPADAARDYAIQSGGSFSDCDGDGVPRRDAPLGVSGDDCDDEDPATRPGTTDDCADSIDSDCDPGTCPRVDQAPPVLSALGPGGVLGCQRRVSLRITDDGRVTFASLRYPDAPLPGGTDRVQTLNDDDGDGVWQTAPLAQIAFGLAEGRQRVRASATDDQGNTGTLDGEIELAFAAPGVTLSPGALGTLTGPVDIMVMATALHGIASVVLEVRTRDASGVYEAASARELARFTAASGAYVLDPASLADGTYALYAVVEDQRGNRLAPAATAYLNAAGDALTAEPGCGAAPPVELPARTFVAGQSPFRPARMRELLARALAEAAALSPALQLVQINGLEVQDDGRVLLDSSSDFTARWLFGFYEPGANRWATVNWLAQAHGRPAPYVDPNATNLSATEPLADLPGLADSDRVASAFFASPNCPASFPPGARGSLLYLHDAADGDTVLVNGGGEVWRAAADLSRVLLTCN